MRRSSGAAQDEVPCGLEDEGSGAGREELRDKVAEEKARKVAESSAAHRLRRPDEPSGCECSTRRAEALRLDANVHHVDRVVASAIRSPCRVPLLIVTTVFLLVNQELYQRRSRRPWEVPALEKEVEGDGVLNSRSAWLFQLRPIQRLERVGSACSSRRADSPPLKRSLKKNRIYKQPNLHVEGEGALYNVWRGAFRLQRLTHLG
jgi:hypothetical protein